MANHGVFASRRATSIVPTNTATTGIPFVIGVAPLSTVDAEDRAAVGVPVLATSFDAAENALGYSENWTDYNISKFMYYWFKLCSLTPAVFLPLAETLSTQSFNGDGSKKTFTITSKPKTVQTVTVGGSSVAISSYNPATGDVTLASAPVSGTNNVVATYLTRPSAADVAAAVEKIDLCMARFGVVPDLILAPDYSDDAAVAAAMATKAASINGMFQGKALVDIEAATYTAAITAKNGGSFTKEELVCWPYGKVGDLIFNWSIIEAGRIALTDVDNVGVPYESPSNKSVPIDSLCTADGTEIILTLAEANLLNAAGIVTGLNFSGGWMAWGNYTGAFPGSTDVIETLIPITRMFDWVGNTVIKTFWQKVDRPMNRRLVDSIIDSANIWINGLVSREYLLGGRVEMLDAENPLTDLMAGICRLHIFLTPPSPAQEIDFILEYDASYVQSVFSA